MEDTFDFVSGQIIDVSNQTQADRIVIEPTGGVSRKPSDSLRGTPSWKSDGTQTFLTIWFLFEQREAKNASPINEQLLQQSVYYTN